MRLRNVYPARVALLFLALLGGCSSILPQSAPPPKMFALDYEGKTAANAAPADGPVILVTSPRAAAGFDRPRMVYVRQAHQIEYFTENQWVDTPARMLTPLLASALERSGAFRAVLQAPAAAAGQVRLDTEIVRLQQEFMGAGSRERFTLRARLVDDATRNVIATREFEAVVDAPAATPYGGVQAANTAVSQVLDQVAIFCAQNSRNLKPLLLK